MTIKIKAILILISTIATLTNTNAKALNKAELLDDFSSQYITINLDNKTYCIEATENEFIPVTSINGCHNISDISIMNKGSVCIDDEDVVCKKINRQSSGVFWGAKNKIKFSQSIEELESRFNDLEDNDKDKSSLYIKQARKYFKAKKYYKAYDAAKKAADLGNKDGYYGIGLAFEKGYGVEDKNKKEAIKWYRKAAEMGHIRAQAKMSDLVRFDDPDEAIKWLKKAAENGNTSSMNNLGYMWAKGHMSTFGNPSKAYEWYMKSAKLGNKIGQYNVCLSLYYGKGVSKNKKEARKWCQRAVDQGYKKAEALLEKTKSW